MLFLLLSDLVELDLLLQKLHEEGFEVDVKVDGVFFGALGDAAVRLQAVDFDAQSVREGVQRCGGGRAQCLRVFPQTDLFRGEEGSIGMVLRGDVPVTLLLEEVVLVLFD